MNENKTVTLAVGPETLTVLADTEMQMHEVSKWTGYNAEVLRRLDNEGKIVPAHRRGIARFWYAHEVARIAERRAKTAKSLSKHVGRLPRFIRAKKRELAP